MKPPLTAAIKRLRSYTKWDGDSDHPYLDRKVMKADAELILRALKLLDDAQHSDDHDGIPVFTIDPDCLWTHAPKGLVHCLGMALVNEDAPEGATFQ